MLFPVTTAVIAYHAIGFHDTGTAVVYSKPAVTKADVVFERFIVMHFSFVPGVAVEIELVATQYNGCLQKRWNVNDVQFSPDAATDASV